MLAALGVYGSVSKGRRKEWEGGKEKHKIFHENRNSFFTFHDYLYPKKRDHIYVRKLVVEVCWLIIHSVLFQAYIQCCALRSTHKCLRITQMEGSFFLIHGFWASGQF